MYRILFFVGSFFWLACGNKQEAPEPVKPIVQKFTLPEWAKNATIYEANTRHMSDKGDFNGLMDQLPRIADMGIDIIWLMPIHPISVVKRKASGDVLVSEIEDENERTKYLGSPYAVANYKEVNPDFGSFEDFKRLVGEIHRLGMRVIIDWVPNHTGWDNPWIEAHPDWYTKDKDGNITDPINDDGQPWGWTDVADLNYDNADMRAAMIDALKFWLTEADIDGFRMDVAHGIPQDFWDECMPQLTATKSDIFLLAESEVPSHRNDYTFHADYGWSLHHLLNEIARGEKNAKDIDLWYSQDTQKYEAGFHMHFTSNHDENAWAGTVFDRMGDAHLTLAALAASFDGMPLLYSGMEEPMKKRLKFFEKDNIGFSAYAYAPFYKKLFELKHRNRALWNGEYGGPLEKLSDDAHVYAFIRTMEADTVVGIFNLTDTNRSINLSQAIKGTEVIRESAIDWKAGHRCNLGPWEYYLISNK